MSILTQRKVLVLNKGWNPVAVVTVERAMCLVCTTYADDLPKATIMDPTMDAKSKTWVDFRDYTWAEWAELIPSHGEGVIHSAKRSFRIPEIVLLTRYNKLPQQRAAFSRRSIYKRDRNQCQYCGCSPGTPELSIDHVLPRSRGGLTTWENCVLACTDCNRKKADRTPKECGMVLRSVPKKPRFTFYKGDYRCKSWEAILGAAYWEIELDNDMDEA
jgi:5-methylcytosine-specific restriction endonuclease McrA